MRSTIRLVNVGTAGASVMTDAGVTFSSNSSIACSLAFSRTRKSSRVKSATGWPDLDQTRRDADRFLWQNRNGADDERRDGDGAADRSRGHRDLQGLWLAGAAILAPIVPASRSCSYNLIL